MAGDHTSHHFEVVSYRFIGNFLELLKLISVLEGWATTPWISIVTERGMRGFNVQGEGEKPSFASRIRDEP